MGKHFNWICTVLAMLVGAFSLGSLRALSQELTVNFSPPLLVSNSPGYSQLADISIDPDGDIYVVWEDRSVEQAFFSCSVDGGTTFSKPVALAPSIEEYSYGYSRVASSLPGEVHVAFTVYDVWYGAAEIAYTGSSDGGTTFSQPVFVSEIDTYNSYVPRIATGWATAIVWVDSDLSNGMTAIKYSQSVDGGATFPPPRSLNGTQGQVTGANVALWGEGMVYVAWMENDDQFGAEDAWEVFFTKSVDHGKTFSTPVNISNFPQKSWSPQMAVDGSGNIYLVWTEGSAFTDMKLLFTRSVDGGNSFADPRILVGPLSTLHSQPSITANGDGNVWISWWNGNGFVTRSTDSGLTFSPAVPLPGGFTIASVEPDVVHVVWNGAPQGDNGSYIYYSRGIGSPRVAVLAPTSLSVPSADSDGTYTVGWDMSATDGVQYILEEATDSNFTNPRTAYSGTELTTVISRRSSGVTYYYRVKATLSGYKDSIWVNGRNGCVVTFPAVLTVQVNGTYYCPTLIAAFTGAIAGDNIKAQEMEFVDGPISLNTTGLVTFQGGYDKQFKTRLGSTTLDGNLTLIKGTLVVDGLTIS